MAEAKLAPNLPDWIVEHVNRYLASGGTDGHMYKVTVPQRGEITAPALLLTTTGRKSGDKFIFPLFYGTDGGSYFVIASKGGAPEHPGWYRNILANPRRRSTSRDQEDERSGQDNGGRGTPPTLEKGARILAALRRLSAQNRARDTGSRVGSGPLGYVAAGRGGDRMTPSHGIVTLATSSAPSWRLCPATLPLNPALARREVAPAPMRTSPLSKHRPEIAASKLGDVRDGEILDCQANAAFGLEIGRRVGSRPAIGIVRMIFLSVDRLTPFV